MNHCSYCNGKMECEGIEDFDIDEIRRQAFEEALEIVGKPKKRKATHGSCCTCQTCGYAHDECECDHNRTIDEIRTKLQEKINELEAVK